MIDEKILNILRNNPGDYISSEELCKDIDLSRTAIWKHVERLREEGYDIEASPHLGYRLIKIPDSLIPMEIRWRLKTKILGREIISYKRIDSTNAAAYSLAEKGIKEGTVVLAEEQAAGKGRLGRVWASPAKGGIYMSCILRPKIPPNEIPRITLLAAVSVAKSIREITGLLAMIKWPNDILVNDRKVCGILTEMKAEQDTIDFVVVGVGINVNTPLKFLPKGASSLREELKSLEKKESLSRIELVKDIIEKLEGNYILMKDKGFGPIIKAWKDLSAMLGSRVRIVLPNKTFEGQAHDIDIDGALIVRRESGIMERVSSGDVVVVR